VESAEIKLWVAFGLISIGSVLITWLLSRNVSQMDKLLEDHDERHASHERAIADLRVDVTKAHSGNEALTEHVRLLRQDVREMRNGLDVYFQKIMDVIGGRK